MQLGITAWAKRTWKRLPEIFPAHARKHLVVQVHHCCGSCLQWRCILGIYQKGTLSSSNRKWLCNVVAGTQEAHGWTPSHPRLILFLTLHQELQFEERGLYRSLSIIQRTQDLNVPTKTKRLVTKPKLNRKWMLPRSSTSRSYFEVKPIQSQQVPIARWMRQ